MRDYIRTTVKRQEIELVKKNLAEEIIGPVVLDKERRNYSRQKPIPEEVLIQLSQKDPKAKYSHSEDLIQDQNLSAFVKPIPEEVVIQASNNNQNNQNISVVLTPIQTNIDFEGFNPIEDNTEELLAKMKNSNREEPIQHQNISPFADPGELAIQSSNNDQLENEIIIQDQSLSPFLEPMSDEEILIQVSSNQSNQINQAIPVILAPSELLEIKLEEFNPIEQSLEELLASMQNNRDGELIIAVMLAEELITQKQELGSRTNNSKSSSRDASYG